MMQIGLRERPIAGSGTLFVSEAGRFFSAPAGFADRHRQGRLSLSEVEFLRARGFTPGEDGDLAGLSHQYDLAMRSITPDELDYLILVPTLRCNLACSYCQVSRADERARGFDWSQDTLGAVLALIGRMTAKAVKIEFQGGEPTLRPDLIAAVIAACDRFERAEFVICTNLARLDEATLALFDRSDMHVSTSLDGPLAVHRQHRTNDAETTNAFAANLEAVIARYGSAKVSALPTIDPRDPPGADDLIDAFASYGLHQIFLRPINFQGFARKRHAHAREIDDGWNAYHRRFVRRLIERNWADRSTLFEETYFSLCLRRIFQPGHDRHVDLRNPSPAGVDYIVIDHDGAVYPTDEARMLTRSRVIDLRIGDVATGWDSETRAALSAAADNWLDPACNTCAYQPYCGRDVIDDLSRYGRIDLPRHETEFCRRHLGLFDFAFELIHDHDPAVQYSLRRWLRLRGDGAPLATMP